MDKLKIKNRYEEALKLKSREQYAKALKESEKASKKTKKAGVDYQKTLNATKTKVQELYKSIKGDAAQKDIEELD
jgi:hypothetical protein